MTTAIEGEKDVTLNRVWPALIELRAVLEPKIADIDLISKMKAAGREYINKPERKKYFEATLLHKLALFLHPQMNKMSFLSHRGK